MKKIVIPFIIIIVSVFIGCGKSHIYSQLVLADSLFANNNTDSASSMLKSIDKDKMNDEEYAYYRMLKVIENYENLKETKNDTLINQVISYYTTHSDKEKLARAYYLKGVMQDEYNDVDKSFGYLKKAELLASETNNFKLQHDIYIFLCYLNNVAGNLNVAVEYAHKAMNVSETIGNKRLLGADYMQLSSSYHYMNKKDSSDYYIDKFIPYLKYQPEKELPDMMNNIAVSYFERSDTAKAKEYLKKSLAIKPNEHTYFLLAELYSAENKEDEARKMWEKALNAQENYMKEGITRMYAEWLKKHGQYKEATDMTATADSLKEESANKYMGETILTLQNKYDSEYMENRSKKHITTIGIIMTVFILFIIALWIFYHKHMKKVQYKILATYNAEGLTYKEEMDQLKDEHQEREKYIKELQDNIERLSKEKEKLEQEKEKDDRKFEELKRLAKAKARQIRQLEETYEQTSKELKSLQAKIKRKNVEQNEMMDKGLEKYTELVNNGKASQWNKADTINFLGYFYTTNPDMFNKVKQNYENLSPNQELAVILIEMGKSDDEVRNILGLSSGALRTTRSRLNAKRRMKSVQ